MKQTAVEYLLEYCERENWSIPFDVEHTAKEMEKEQNDESYQEGYQNGHEAAMNYIENLIRKR